MTDIVARLLRQDSSAYMDGSHNWVLDAHPEDAEKRGEVVVHVPWQAWYLLGEAADEIRQLRGQRDRLLAVIQEQQSLAPADRVMARVWTAAAEVRAEMEDR